MLKSFYEQNHGDGKEEIYIPISVSPELKKLWDKLSWKAYSQYTDMKYFLSWHDVYERFYDAIHIALSHDCITPPYTPIFSRSYRPSKKFIAKLYALKKKYERTE